MKIATILFTYNRSNHTKRTLEALYKNKKLPEKLFIFQDGPKDKNDLGEWHKVNNIIKNVNWCKCSVIVSDINKGLKNSILYGVNYVFNFFDAVIVLEDDCVAHPLFITYMYNALSKYCDNQQVYSISGSNVPSDFNENGTDAFFSGRIESWGWGTWKNRWKKMKEDYGILARIKKDEETYKRFRIWGSDFESYLLGNIEGTCNSWATFWGMTVIENNGVCLQPYKSLIDQIGVDGTGTHSGVGEFKQRLRDIEDLNEIVLPDKIEITKDTEERYQEYYYWTAPEKRRGVYNDVLLEWIEMKRRGKSIKKYLDLMNKDVISIYGKGSLCDLLINEIENKKRISSVIVTNPLQSFYNDLPLVDIENMPVKTNLIVVIPIYDYEIIKRKIKRVTTCEVMGIDQLIEEASNI